MPQPMHSSSEIHAILELGVTSIHSLPADKPQSKGGSLSHPAQPGPLSQAAAELPSWPPVSQQLASLLLTRPMLSLSS